MVALNDIAVADIRAHAKAPRLGDMTREQLHAFLNADTQRMAYLFEKRAVEFHDFVTSKGWR